MRIDASRARVVISPVGASTPSRAFREHVARSAPSVHLTASQAQSLLGAAWQQVVGAAPNAKTAALLTAHWALETDGGRAMPGHNFAGIKAGPHAPGAEFRTVEGHGVTAHEVSARFRIYESAEAGAQGYVALLQTRFPAALEAARQGDTAGFAHALASGGYFTADPHAYAAGLQQRLTSLEGGGPLPRTSASSLAAPGSLSAAALGGVLRALHEPHDDA